MTDDLHYDITGQDGPVLLILPGGAGHPMGLTPLTEALAEHFTVVLYDPLGLAHGRLGEPVDDQRVEEWSDSARRVLDEVLPEGESAYVFGTSSGGIAALDLAARHSARLRHVVAHEPPCVEVLPDGAQQLAGFQEVYDTYRTAGLATAAARMTALLEGQSHRDSTPNPQPLSREEELTTPVALFLAHVLRPFTAYTPQPPHTRLTLAAGTDSRGQLLHHTAESLAKTLHGDFVELPGGHLGAVQQPEAFAERLTETLLVGQNFGSK